MLTDMQLAVIDDRLREVKEAHVKRLRESRDGLLKTLEPSPVLRLPKNLLKDFTSEEIREIEHFGDEVCNCILSIMRKTNININEEDVDQILQIAEKHVNFNLYSNRSMQLESSILLWFSRFNCKFNPHDYRFDLVHASYRVSSHNAIRHQLSKLKSRLQELAYFDSQPEPSVTKDNLAGNILGQGCNSNFSFRSKKDTGKRMPYCGIIMPISARNDYVEAHWQYMKTVYQAVAKEALGSDAEVNLVSDAADSGLIQERIVSNIYKSDIIICDVSGGYPNVFLEVGLALAWDKPIVLTVDEKSRFEFDIGGLEHTPYHSSRAVPEFDGFRERLGNKIIGTYQVAKSDKDYSPYMRAFLRRQGFKRRDEEFADVKEVISSLQKQIGQLTQKVDRPPFQEYMPKMDNSGGVSGIEESEIVKMITNKWIYENSVSGLVSGSQLDQLVQYIISENPLTVRSGERPDVIKVKAVEALDYFGVKVDL